MNFYFMHSFFIQMKSLGWGEVKVKILTIAIGEKVSHKRCPLNSMFSSIYI